MKLAKNYNFRVYQKGNEKNPIPYLFICILPLHYFCNQKMWCNCYFYISLSKLEFVYIFKKSKILTQNLRFFGEEGGGNINNINLNFVLKCEYTLSHKKFQRNIVFNIINNF